MYFNRRTKQIQALKKALVNVAAGTFRLIESAVVSWRKSRLVVKIPVFVLTYLLVANYRTTGAIDLDCNWTALTNLLVPRNFWLALFVLTFFLLLEIPWRRTEERPSRRAVLPAAAGRVPRPVPSTEQASYDRAYPKFVDVGGLEEAKKRITDLVKIRLDSGASRYRIDRNGILLHGPPGCGKSFLARATANEFGLYFSSISLSELLSSYVFHSIDKIAGAFARAAEKKPALIFLDEFDAVAGRRENARHPEHMAATNQLLQSIDRYRSESGLVLMAATNLYNHLDPAVIRDGRFDLKMRIDYPDASGRRKILDALLRSRPWKRSDLATVLERTDGWSPSKLAALVEHAALQAYYQEREITTEDLENALRQAHFQDRPSLPDYRLEDLILPPDLIDDLRLIIRLLTSPELVRQLDLEPPSGILLKGAPGTGKTMLAQVLAKETRHSFYPITPKDILSLWVGDSPRNLSQVFDRAREHAPSILFFDDMDALFPHRGPEGVAKFYPVAVEVVNQFLLETNALSPARRVFLIGASNRPESIDPAVLRGGRFSEHIDIPPPTFHLRIRFFERYLAGRALERNLTYESLARITEGFTGADLKALCCSALRRASGRALLENQPLLLRPADFRKALGKLHKAARASTPD